MQSALFASAVYQPRRDADPERFDGKNVRGEIDQTVLEHTLRNISYRKIKGRQPCDDAPNSVDNVTDEPSCTALH
ncbi:jg17489 [Pararge aegeria aegeria]|uniref:Jg17489 protein n=1 Tax=Pararge aegeria aegeria TaxID=348720 RepID=A0A8S4RLB8_9NEOP|nr:jg17489 [Pararge aegeria aegeria]